MELNTQDIVSFRPKNNSWIHSEIGYRICKYAYHVTGYSYSPDINGHVTDVIWHNILDIVDKNFVEYINTIMNEVIKYRVKYRVKYH